MSLTRRVYLAFVAYRVSLAQRLRVSQQVSAQVNQFLTNFYEVFPELMHVDVRDRAAPSFWSTVIPSVDLVL